MSAAWKDRLLLFALAILVRGWVGWIFFGSVDLTNAFLYAEALLAGHPPSSIPVPYLPGLYHLVVWIAGVLTVATPFPPGFVFKLFPILFDGVLAAAIYDGAHLEPREARIAGTLYALAPTSILITAVHTQWDSIAFAFFVLALLLVARAERSAHWLAGAAAFLSVVAKPVALPFFLFLLPSARTTNRAEMRGTAVGLLGGATSCAVLYVAVLAAIGNPFMLQHFSIVLDYAGKGGIFGLPKLLQIDAKRLYGLGAILAVFPLYWTARSSRLEAVLLALCAVMGASALAPQYLLWPLPIILLCRRFRFAAMYGAVSGAFLSLSYLQPGPTGMNMENLGAFAPLRSFSWLAPGAFDLAMKLMWWTALGNAALPAVLLAFLGLTYVRAARREPAAFTAPAAPLRAILAPVLGVMACVVVTAVFAASSPISAKDFSATLQRKVQRYEMVRYQGPGLVKPWEPSWVVPAFAGEISEHRRGSPLHAGTLSLAAVLAWSALTLVIALRRTR